MVYLYIAFFIYLIGACFYLDADYRDNFKNKFWIKIFLSILYLTVAVLAFLLNRIDGNLVAVSHFKWIFCGMLLVFYGDISLIWKEDDKSFFIGQFAYLVSKIIFSIYFVQMLYKATGEYFSSREILIFVGALILIGIIIKLKNIEKIAMKLLVILVTITSAFMVAKSSSLIQFMNTSFSWPLFIGVLLLSFGNSLRIFDKFAKKEHIYIKGLYNMLHFIGIVVLPLGIYYV